MRIRLAPGLSTRVRCLISSTRRSRASGAIGFVPAARLQDLGHDRAAEDDLAGDARAIGDAGRHRAALHERRDDVGFAHQDRAGGLILARHQDAGREERQRDEAEAGQQQGAVPAQLGQHHRQAFEQLRARRAAGPGRACGFTGRAPGP
jgi:hypothetical protein